MLVAWNDSWFTSSQHTNTKGWTSALLSFHHRYRLRDESFHHTRANTKKKWFHCQTFPNNFCRSSRELENKKSSHRKFIGNLHNIRLPLSVPAPGLALPPPASYVRSLFHFSCRKEDREEEEKKGYKWIERENNLLIFGFDAVLSQHFNPFVTIFCSNKPFLCIARGWATRENGTRYTSLIFLLRFSAPIHDCRGGKCGNEE